MTTDQNSIASFGIAVETSQSDTYTFIAQAPLDWSVGVDDAGLVTIQPVAGARGVAARDDVLYVCGSNGISIVDYSDPENPTLEGTVGSETQVGCRIENDLLVALRASFGQPLILDVYSIKSDPLNPVLLGSSPAINYTNLSSGLEVNDTHAFVTQFTFCFFLGSNDIFAHQGDLFSIALNLEDPQNPTSAAPALESVLFDTFGDATPGGPGDQSGCALNGGDHNIFGVAFADPQTAYLASSSVVGGNTQAGVGQVEVVDVSDPTDPEVVANLEIPGTVQAVGIGVQGNTVVVIGITTGWNDPIDGLRSGNLTVTTLDLSDPLEPTILAHRTLDRRARTFWTNMGNLGNGLFAFSSIDFDGSEQNAEVLLIDASNPRNPVVAETNTPIDASPPQLNHV